jgi:hypothetical protein
MSQDQAFQGQRLPGSHLELPAARDYPCLTSLAVSGADEV